MKLQELPLPVPEPVLDGPVGPLIDAVQHTALKLGQRVQGKPLLVAPGVREAPDVREKSSLNRPARPTPPAVLPEDLLDDEYGSKQVWRQCGAQ